MAGSVRQSGLKPGMNNLSLATNGGILGGAYPSYPGAPTMSQPPAPATTPGFPSIPSGPMNAPGPYKPTSLTNPTVEDLARIAGVKARDTLYSQYTSAVSDAKDQAASMLRDTAALMRLHGTEYKYDPAKQDKLTQHVFESMWTQQQQSNLERLLNQWGAPKDFKGFEYVPAKESAAGKEASPDAAERKKAAASGQKQGPSESTIIGELGDDAPLGGGSSLLGG